MAFYKEEGGRLVPMSDVPQEAVLAIERADEETIIQSLTGEFGAEAFMYHYPIKGGDVYGIGTDGAKEVARLLGNIEVLPDIRMDKESDPDYIYAMVRAKNLVNNVTLVGVGRQCKYYLTEGNIPTDRINEYAFVISVSKGQRNAILSVAPQETIAKIIQTFKEQKKLKKLPPSYGAPQALSKTAPAKAAPATVGTEEEVLKKLRQQVGIEAGKVFKTEEERKVWQKEQYNVDSMTELSEEKLKDMLAKMKEKQAAPLAQPSITDLGFSGEAEQNQMRKELFSLIEKLGNKTVDEIRDYITKKGWGKTTAVTKETLASYIEEVKHAATLVKEAENIPENV